MDEHHVVDSDAQLLDTASTTAEAVAQNLKTDAAHEAGRSRLKQRILADCHLILSKGEGEADIPWTIATGKGETTVMAPANWSKLAVKILATKYMRRAGVPAATVRVPGDPSIPTSLLPSVPTPGTAFGQETSATQVFDRLAGAWAFWLCRPIGPAQRGIVDGETALILRRTYHALLRRQVMAPNSPQWFNCGLHWAYGISGPGGGNHIIDPETQRIVDSTSTYEHAQVHACFINSVADDLVRPGGILDFAVREAKIFKLGSGSGANVSNLRGDHERLSGGGMSSGMLSFLKIGDAAAGAIKSGGTTRRAAKMIVVDVDHPQIEGFIEYKTREERKVAALVAGSASNARHGRAIYDAVAAGRDGEAEIAAAALALMPAGAIEQTVARAKNGLPFRAETYDTGWESEAYGTVAGQNANNSVRVSDRYLKAIEADDDWNLINRGDGEVAKTLKAREIWNLINENAWASGDPGLQYQDTINLWHTCKASGEIRGSNPCCFVGGSYVDTSEGLIDIAELTRRYEAGEALPYAFSFDFDTGLPVLKPILRAWKAGETKQLAEVATAAGEALRCTRDHKWYLRNGKAVEAAKLEPGASLRKISRGSNDARSGRRSIYTRVDAEGRSSHVQTRWMWEQVNGPIPEGHEVHHKNEDPTDDRLSNLELRPTGAHRSHHAVGLNNPNSVDVAMTDLVEIYDAITAQPRMTHKNRVEAVTPTRWNNYIKANRLDGIVPKASSPTNEGRIRGMAWPQFVGAIDEARHAVNDKVDRVTLIDLEEPVPVYDIEVEGTHNFGIKGDKNGSEPSLVVSNSEYFFLDNTGCNLASVRLTAMLADNDYDVAELRAVCEIVTLALDVSVTLGQYPSSEIAEGTRDFRTLGLGFADLGGLLMRLGIAYDSTLGRAVAANLASVMTASAYATSGLMAGAAGVFPRWHENRASMAEVMERHGAAHADLRSGLRRAHSAVAERLINACIATGDELWKTVLDQKTTGYRNAQVTVVAPTGTIGLVMDCDTTGIEPDYSLVKHKELAGGGYMTIVNNCVPDGLKALGYTDGDIEAISKHVVDHNGMDDCELVRDRDRPVFDTASPNGAGTRFIAPYGHVDMMAAVQPFISGGISKTVNLPNSATMTDMADIHMRAWQKGVKSIAVYRDKSKLSQPLNAKAIEKIAGDAELAKELKSAVKTNDVSGTVSLLAASEIVRSRRHKLPARRIGYTQKSTIDGHRIYLRTGNYPDGTLGEIFIDMHKEGAAFRSLMNNFAIAISLGLQYGVPLEEFVDAFSYTRFEPQGMVRDHDGIKKATSVLDLIFRDLAAAYLGRTDLLNIKPPVAEERATDLGGHHNEGVLLKPTKEQEENVLALFAAREKAAEAPASSDAVHYTGLQCENPACMSTHVTRSGTCAVCQDCGESVGGC